MNPEQKLQPKPEWGLYATFVPNKQERVHNWFYFKEGFSRQLIEILLKKFKLIGCERSEQYNIGNSRAELENFTISTKWVLDPFVGSGTTLLTCKQHGINAVGFDVLPISVFASKVKTEDYNTEQLKEEAQNLLKIRFECPDKKLFPPELKRFFSNYAIEDILFLRRAIAGIKNEKIRNFFIMALVNTSMKISYAWKDGAVLKARKHPTPPLRKLYKRIVKNMIRDIEKTAKSRSDLDIITEAKMAEAKSQNQPKTIVQQADARRLPIEDNSVDAIITSPPYLNNIDYTKVYAIENWLVKNVIPQEPPIRSYIGLGKTSEHSEDDMITSAKRELISNLPLQAQAYFKDMHEVLREMYRVCKGGANVAIVVGNAYLQQEQQAIESDVILAEMAHKIGFEVRKILVVNERAALRDRTTKVGSLRESVILLKK